MRANAFLSFLLVVCLATLDAFGASKGGSVSIRGHVRKDGTYVAPHFRSAPDGNFYNNWSTKGNVNPYTGQAATMMKEKARDIDVAKEWKEKGCDFNPNFMSAAMMDAKVREVNKSKISSASSLSRQSSIQLGFSMIDAVGS